VSDAVSASKIVTSNYDVVVVVHANKSYQESWLERPNWDLMTTQAWPALVLVSESELMGAWAHEIGHTLGLILQPSRTRLLPDLYGEKTVGEWDLMGSGSLLGNPFMSHPDHMSSFSKEWLGWLKYKSLYYPNTGTYWINSITTMKYGDSIIRYLLEENLDPQAQYRNYYIIETRTNNPAYSKWDTSAPIPQGYSNALVLYQVDEFENQNSTVNFIDNLTIGSGSHSSYWDFANLIRFAAFEQRARTEGTRSIFEMNVEITKFSISNKVGAISTPNGNLLGYVPNAPSVPYNGGQILPDFDLHAYALDGRHIGVNYTTRAYENQIEGANASGDLLNGREWIFVPDNVKVQFVVDSRDIQAFLNRYPDLQKIINGTQPYNLSIVYDSPESVRYSTSVEQSIQPGEAKKYNYFIAGNPDGTYRVVLDNMPPVISNTVPTDATNNAQISAEFTDNSGGSGIDTGSISFSIGSVDATRDATINGSSISVEPMLKDGLYEVFLIVSDKVGNKATANWSFTLDTAPPEITISNVSALTNQNVSPDIKVIDARDAKPAITVSLDGIVYDGSPISTEGEHTLTVVASDELRNTAVQTLNFIIDKTRPSISIGGVNDGAYYNIDVTPVIAIMDTNLDTSSITLNGAPFVSGTVVSAEGNYALVASAMDKAGNSDSKTINFVVDKTPPSVSITGAENDGFYNTSKTISYVVTDDVDASPLISANYVNGAIFSEEGDYSVQITASDHAGNIAVKTLNFTIDKTSPLVDIISPTNDSYIGGKVKITGTATDLHIIMFSLEIDGISVINNTE
jgi:hypothetical protein